MLIYSGILSSIKNPRGAGILKIEPLTYTIVCMKSFSKIATSVTRCFLQCSIKYITKVQS